MPVRKNQEKPKYIPKEPKPFEPPSRAQRLAALGNLDGEPMIENLSLKKLIQFAVPPKPNLIECWNEENEYGEAFPIYSMAPIRKLQRGNRDTIHIQPLEEMDEQFI